MCCISNLSHTGRKPGRPSQSHLLGLQQESIVLFYLVKKIKKDLEKCTKNFTDCVPSPLCNYLDVRSQLGIANQIMREDICSEPSDLFTKLI